MQNCSRPLAPLYLWAAAGGAVAHSKTGMQYVLYLCSPVFFPFNCGKMKTDASEGDSDGWVNRQCPKFLPQSATDIPAQRLTVYVVDNPSPRYSIPLLAVNSSLNHNIAIDPDINSNILVRQLLCYTLSSFQTGFLHTHEMRGHCLNEASR
jgi:hypothetical protein